MEDSPYSTLKCSLSTIPAKALNYSSRIILANNLDVKQVLPSKGGHARDYRGFAELMGFEYNDTKKFERFDDPTLKILEAWEIRPDAMLAKLIDYLEEMERHDVINELIPMLEKNAETFTHSQRLQEIPIQVPEVTSCRVSMHGERGVLTRDDLKTGECTKYDAYVSYADEDSGFISKLASYLESPEVGLKLFIRGRDMLAGCSELDTNIELIKNRCRRMLIILTNSFLHSPQCEFQVSFAASLAIDQRERILVPIVIAPCDIPSILLRVSKIDFTNPDIYEWMWEKLITSLLPEGRNLMFLSSMERFPMQRCMPQSAESVVYNNSMPVITFPETTKQLALPLDKSPQVSLVEIPCEVPNEISCKEVPTEIPSIISSQNPCISAQNLTPVPAKTNSYKRFKNTFRSYFWKGNSSTASSLSSSTSSGATSGFHSNSTASENFKCFNEGFSSDTSL